MWYALLGRVVWMVGKRVVKRKLGPGLALRGAGVAGVAVAAVAGVARARRSLSRSSDA